MKLNKKIFCLFIVLTMLFAVGMVSATEDISDVVAAENSAADTEVLSVTSDDAIQSQSSDDSYVSNSSESVSTYVITNSTFNNYFTDGELNSNVTTGSILDFQGTFTGLNYTVNITKPVSIISSTGDALFDNIGKTATLGGCFHISTGGSGTNVTGLNFLNSAFYVTNASNVLIENISMYCNVSGIGQSTGFMCVRGGSSYVTVKDSYFENNGTGSSIVVIAYSDYCTVDNNEIVISGRSGNALYITTYVAPAGDHYPTGNNITNNYIHGNKNDAGSFCYALCVAGYYNLIANNTIDFDGTGITNQFSGWGTLAPENNTYIGNVLTGGCSMATSDNSYVSENDVEGIMTVGANNVVENNEMKTLTISKANVVVENNIIGTGGVTLNAAASNTTLIGNIIYSTVNVKSKNNTIQKNTIDSTDDYAVNLNTAVDNEVSYNNLSSKELSGDEAVNNAGNNSVHDNGAIENIVTEDNFFYFFDDEGNYKNLNFTELFFKGDFDAIVDAITINTPLTVIGLNATLNNMAFILNNDSIALQNFTMILDDAPITTGGAAILVNGSNIAIIGFDVDYTLNESSDAYVILAEGCDNLTIIENEFTFSGKTDGSDVNNIVLISDADNVIFDSNVVDAALPSCYVDWKEVPAGSGIWVKFPVSEGFVFDECTNLKIDNNQINVYYNDVVGSYDTIYTIDIKNSENVSLSNNTVDASGHSYIYGAYIGADNTIVDSNTFTIDSDGYYANALEIEGSTNVTISNNDFDVVSTDVAYPIFSGMNGGDLEVDYIGNNINATADIVYAMELMGSYERIINNTFTVNGNRTTAIACESKESFIYNNTINALGLNLGNTTTPDVFDPMTVGIYLYKSSAIVESNTINSNSRGMIAEYGEVYFEDNVLNVADNGGDDSYAIFSEKSEIVIANNNITYVGNTSGSKTNKALNLVDCTAPQVLNNIINITIPSCYVQWSEIPAGSGNWVSSPISEGVVIDSDNAVMENNNVTVNYNSVVGSYDTIYAVHIISDNASVKSNEIDASGHTYIYGLEISGDNFTVENNTILSVSDIYYANGIDIEGPANGLINLNLITTLAPGVVYPVYSAMSNGNVSVDYLGNIIIAKSSGVYAMDLAGIKANATANVIYISGNESIGINSKANEFIAQDNIIVANSTSALGIKASKGNATVTDNNITVTGEYTVDVNGSEALVKDNYLVASELTGDASVNFVTGDSEVYNNTPKMDKVFLDAEDLIKYFGSADKLEATLIDASGEGVANKTVSFTINGNKYNRTTDDNGTAKIAINLMAGTYNVTVEYAGDYNLSSDVVVTVLPTIEGNDITKIFKNGTQYYATFVDTDGNLLVNTTVQFNINGVFYNRTTDENGTAKLNINLNPGEYIITATNPNSTEQYSNTITVLAPIVENNDLTKYYKNDSQYVVKVLDDEGNPVGENVSVTFNINGVFYTRYTNASGYVKLNINLAPGDYIITAEYNGFKTSNNISVLPTLKASDLSMTYKDGSKFNATVLDGTGSPLANVNVTFNINGVFYNRVSDSNGIASLNINLMAGEYIITSSYNGLNIANKITISS